MKLEQKDLPSENLLNLNLPHHSVYLKGEVGTVSQMRNVVGRDVHCSTTVKAADFANTKEKIVTTAQDQLKLTSLTQGSQPSTVGLYKVVSFCQMKTTSLEGIILTINYGNSFIVSVS